MSLVSPAKTLTYREALLLNGDEEALEKHEFIVVGLEHRKRRITKRRESRLRKRYEKLKKLNPGLP